MTALAGAGAPEAVAAINIPQPAPPTARLAAGPAAATRSSERALGGSHAISATPPKKKSVIPRMEIPWRRATREWASSWTITDANRPRAAMAPIPQYTGGERPGARAGNTLEASDQVTSAATGTQLGSTRMGKPKTRKISKLLPNTVVAPPPLENARRVPGVIRLLPGPPRPSPASPGSTGPAAFPGPGRRRGGSRGGLPLLP